MTPDHLLLEYTLRDRVAERQAAAQPTRFGEGDGVLRFVAWAARGLSAFASMVERWASGPDARTADAPSEFALR